MDDFDATVLQIIANNGGQATTREIIDGLNVININRSKVAVLQRLKVLHKFGYVDTTEGTSIRGRKPLIYTLSGVIE